MIASSPLATSQYSYDTGTGTTSATAPAGTHISRISCVVAPGGAAGSVTITPKGPGQTGIAGGAINVPAGTPFNLDWPNGGPLGPGTIVAFSGVASWYVEYYAKESE
jgi:hypothetical protein